MSTDWYSMTCIGLKVPKEKIIGEIEEIRNLCGCKPQTNPDDHPGGKYCPDCGRLIRRPVKVEKPLFDIPEDYWNEETRIEGWLVKHDSDAYNFYICIYTSGLVEHNKRSDIPDTPKEVLAKFKADMISIGLWDEEQFGLWTVTYCSY